MSEQSKDLMVQLFRQLKATVADLSHAVNSFLRRVAEQAEPAGSARVAATDGGANTL